MSLSSAANPTREPVPDTRKAFQAGVMALDGNYKYLKYSVEYILIILSLSQLLTAPLHLLIALSSRLASDSLWNPG